MARTNYKESPANGTVGELVIPRRGDPLFIAGRISYVVSNYDFYVKVLNEDAVLRERYRINPRSKSLDRVIISKAKIKRPRKNEVRANSIEKFCFLRCCLGSYLPSFRVYGGKVAHKYKGKTYMRRDFKDYVPVCNRLKVMIVDNHAAFFIPKKSGDKPWLDYTSASMEPAIYGLRKSTRSAI